MNRIPTLQEVARMFLLTKTMLLSHEEVGELFSPKDDPMGGAGGRKLVINEIATGIIHLDDYAKNKNLSTLQLLAQLFDTYIEMTTKTEDEFIASLDSSEAVTYLQGHAQSGKTIRKKKKESPEERRSSRETKRSDLVLRLLHGNDGIERKPR